MHVAARSSEGPAFFHRVPAHGNRTSIREKTDTISPRLTGPSHLPRLRLRHRRRASVSHLFPVLTGDFTRRRLRWLPRGPGTNSSVCFSWKIPHSRSRHLSCHRRCSPQVIASRRHRRHQCLRRRRRWPLRRHRLLAMPRQSPVCCRCYFRRSRAAANDRVSRAAITADQHHAARVAPVTPGPTSRHRYLLRGA